MILKQYYLGCLAHASYLIADQAVTRCSSATSAGPICERRLDGVQNDLRIPRSRTWSAAWAPGRRRVWPRSDAEQQFDVLLTADDVMAVTETSPGGYFLLPCREFLRLFFIAPGILLTPTLMTTSNRAHRLPAASS